MAARLRAFDWRTHPFGVSEDWPAELKAIVGLCLRSSMPSAIYWGPELRLLYNDAWSSIPAERHPEAIGRPAAEVWSDIWDVVGPQFHEVVETGRGLSTSDQRLMMLRGGAVQETYWSYSFTPIPGPDGRTLGVFNQGEEVTSRRSAARNQAFLLELGDRLRDLAEGEHEASEVLKVALKALGAHLGLLRAGYAAIDGDQRHCVVLANSYRGDAVDVTAGRHRMADFGESVVADLMNGRVVSSEDVSSDPALPADAVASCAALGVAAVLVAPVMRAGKAIGFLYLNDDRPRRWTSDDMDVAREAADRIWAGLERAHVAARLRASERRFAAIFGQAGVGLSEFDAQGRFIRFNGSMGRILGRDPLDAAGLSVLDVTHPDDVAASRQRIESSYASGEPFELEKRYVRPDGAEIWAISHVTRLLDDEGRAGGFFSVTTDVTDRKEQERIRAWLLAELNHRVKNNLATVQAIARHTMRSTGSAEEFSRVFDSRLMALSRAHDLLTRETWTSAALEDLAHDALAPFQLDDDRRIVIGGPEVRFSPTAAVTMTLAFHELATNAAKFGALSRPEGRVSVSWTVDMTKGGGVVDLEWREEDGPRVDPPARRGFGSRLIERGAARELGGHVTLDFAPEGVACAFHLPLSQKIMAQ